MTLNEGASSELFSRPPHRTEYHRVSIIVLTDVRQISPQPFLAGCRQAKLPYQLFSSSACAAAIHP